MPSPAPRRKASTRRSGQRSTRAKSAAPIGTTDVTITWKLRTDWRAVPLLKRVALHVMTAEGCREGGLSVVVAGARAMSTLHERFLGMSGPTDVLSFDLGSDPDAGRIDGEIIVCADVARREARRHNKTLSAARAELALYVTHGILHLCGYDDHDEAEFEHMHAREDELLEQLDLGRVFSRSG